MFKFGTKKNDLLSDIFHETDDFVFAGKGDDIITSLNGDDLLSGGPGDDLFIVSGRCGQVVILGGKGEDTLFLLHDKPSSVETQGDVTVIVTEDGLELIVRGVEHIEWGM